MPGVQDLPGDHSFRITVPAAMASASTDDEFAGITLPFNGTITGVKWTPNAAVTANGTNFTTVSVRNRGAAGAGSTLPASRSYAATNSVAYATEQMSLSGTASDLAVSAGDHLTVQRIHTASGVSVPGGVVEVSVKIR